MRDGPVVFAASIVVTTNVSINDRLIIHTKQACRGALRLTCAMDTRPVADRRRSALSLVGPSDGAERRFGLHRSQPGR